MITGVIKCWSSVSAEAVATALVWMAVNAGATTYFFDTEVYDPNDIHSLITDTDRFNVPNGTTLIRLLGQESGTGAATPGPIFRKNSASFVGTSIATTQDNVINIKTGPIVTVGGTDYFDMARGSAGTEDLTGGIWFAIETLDPATRYALVNKTGNQALGAGTPTMVSFDNEVVDTDGWHDNSTNNSRLTIPSGLGITRVKLVASLRSTSNVNTPYVVQIKKNGAVAEGMPVFCSSFTGRMSLASAIVEVTDGDYFEIEALTTSAQTIAINDSTWFAIFEEPEYDGALVKKAATQIVTSGVAVAVDFGSGSTVYDTANIHDEGSNSSRLTVPAGFNRAKLSYSLVTASATGVQRAIIRRNAAGSTTIPLVGMPGMDVNITGVDYLSGEGAWVDVVEGDYFELIFTPGANQTLPIDDRTWFSMELSNGE